MNWYDRSINRLDRAWNARNISNEEYFTGLGNIEERNLNQQIKSNQRNETWARNSERNMANFQKASGALNMVGTVAGQFSNMSGGLDDGTATAREGIRGAVGQMGP